MDLSDRNIDPDQEDYTRDDDLPFDPDCTLILYGIHGRNTKGLFKKLSKIGSITYFQPVKHFDTIIFSYSDANTAQEAINTITDEKVLFCTEDTTIQSNSLLLPPKLRNFLTSPPPSPPEDWAPLSEDINRIAFVDLEAKQQQDGTLQLLPLSISSPSIIVTPETHMKTK